MAVKINGVNTEPIPQNKERGSYDKKGVAVVTRVEVCPRGTAPRALYSAHPDYPNLGVSKVDWNEVNAGKFAEITYTYEGTLGESLPDKTYSLAADIMEVPVATHLKFPDLAGQPSAPLNGAIFVDTSGNKTTSDTLGVFQEFSARLPDGTPNPVAGVETAYDFGAIWTETAHSYTVPTELRALGTIDTPPGNPPSFPGRTWLVQSCEYTRRGKLYETTTRWKLSGRRGWNTTLYSNE